MVPLHWYLPLFSHTGYNYCHSLGELSVHHILVTPIVKHVSVNWIYDNSRIYVPEVRQYYCLVLLFFQQSTLRKYIHFAIN
jgi:hypothetical protein